MSSLPSRTMKFVPSLLPILTVGLLAAAATGQANVAEYPFDDGFEGVQLGTGWSWGGDGLVPAKVTSLYDPHSDAQHLQLGGLDEDGAVNCWIQLQIDLEGRQGVLLDFMLRQKDAGISSGEGLFLGPDPQSLQLAWQPDPFENYSDYTRLVFDLDELADSVQLEYNQTFTLRYVWSHWDPTPDGGAFFDDFRIVPTGFTNLATEDSVAPTGLGNFGMSVEGIGDLNGDAVPELIVGHPGYSLKRGRVEVLDGKSLSTIAFVQKGIFGERMGESMASMGDLDGDGFDELVVGAPSNDVKAIDAGAAYIVSPKLQTILGEVHGTEGGEAHGTTVAGVGDLDGDGKPEFLVGSPLADGAGGLDSGRVTLYRGSDQSVWRTFEGAGEASRLGAAMAAGPDLDLDGLPELFLGAPGWTDGLGTTLGRVEAYSATTGTQLRTYVGVRADGQAGSSLCFVEDLTDDGLDDLVVGAPTALDGHGQVRFLDTASGAELAYFDGELPGDHLGSAMVVAGDMDGFSGQELAIGAAADQVGSVLLVRIPELVVLRRASVINPFTGFGSSLAPVGDLNGDGFADLLCGEPTADTTSSQDAGQIRVITTVAPPEVDDVLGLHCTLSGEVVVQGTDMNPGLQFQIDGAPVAFTAVSPVEARIPLGPDLPGGFHDLTVISELGTVELGSAVVRYPALELPDESALGGDVTVRFDNGEPGSYVLAFSGGAYPDPAPFEAWGWFHGLELDGVWMFAAGLLSHGDTERLHVLTAPNDPFFLGHEFHVQAWAFQADLGLMGFSNRATTTVVP